MKAVSALCPKLVIKFFQQKLSLFFHLPELSETAEPYLILVLVRGSEQADVNNCTQVWSVLIDNCLHD